MTASPTDDTHPYDKNAELAKELSRAGRELAEAREQQAATAEILTVISSSPTNVQSVFDVIASSAARLCDALDAVVLRVDGDILRPVAHHGPMAIGDVPLHRGTIGGRAVIERRLIHIEDLQAEVAEFPEGSAFAKLRGHRTTLSIPLLRQGVAIGNIQVRRNEVRLFSEKQIALLQTFADQAVIAIENARLFEAEQASKRELQESLEYQTATGDVLAVISKSPSQLQPVFEAIAQTSLRLCRADRAAIVRLDGGVFRVVARAGSGNPTSLRAAVDASAIPISRASVMGRAVLEGRSIHIDDIRADPEYSLFREVQGDDRRTMLGVPLISQGKVIGVINLVRTVVQPFAARQIALVETFADQAVIAIENTRLFEEVQARTRELTESLEYHTATSEVLQVISSSPTDVQPVFDTIAGCAMRLCSANQGILVTFDGERMHLGALANFDARGVVAMQEVFPLTPTRGSVLGRTIATKAIVHVPSLLDDPEYSFATLAETAGFRSGLGVPMVKDGNVVGAIAVTRPKSGLFSDREIGLLRTFADQAVIAIQNTRLFEEVQARTRELQESLDQQTSSAKVLGVISGAPGNVRPVFDTILAEAKRLCEAQFGVLHRFDGSTFIPVGVHGDVTELVDLYQSGLKPSASNALGRILHTKEPVHMADVREGPGYKAGDPAAKSIVEIGGARSYLLVPLLKDNDVVGSITIFRKEVRPFSEKQIQLLVSFASQAVIAIENARLFEALQTRTRELQESLEYQTATSAVLGIISRSPNELQPVLDGIVETTGRLYRADHAHVFRLRDGKYHLAAHNQTDPHIVEYLAKNPISLDQLGSVTARAARSRKTVHVPDAMQDPEYGHGPLTFSNDRTVLSVPLLRKDAVVGVVTVGRQTLRPFTGKEIELIETFADQAVIAIENTWLFEEVQARNRDLTALGEVGRVVSSTLDLKVVLKAIVDRAVELSGTDAGSIFYLRPEVATFELGETTGLDADVVAKLRKLDISATETGLGEAIANRQPLQAPDVTKRASNPLRDAALDAGFRAALIVPLLGSEGPLGALVLQRRRHGEFPSAVVSLMQSFADQSAIALENARLFEEIAQKSRELEIASQHKSQFVANMSHELRTPLAAVLGYAELIQEGFYGPQPEKSMDALTRIRSNGNHLLSLINTVLDIAKIESGQFKLNLGEYALENVVETVRVATESLAENKKLSLQTEVAKRLPLGLGDEQRLTQVLLNLVGNAIKFTDKGEVRISATAVNGQFAVRVTDTGPGIPVEEQKRVFEQFHQVDSSNTKAKGGTGLGLAIARQIVEMHGGRIWVESAPGKGATFQMHLPIRAEEANGAT